MLAVSPTYNVIVSRGDGDLRRLISDTNRQQQSPFLVNRPFGHFENHGWNCNDGVNDRTGASLLMDPNGSVNCWLISRLTLVGTVVVPVMVTI